MLTKLEIEAMSVDERMSMLESLWENVGPSDEDFPEWQRKILIERATEMEKHQERVIPRDEALRALRSRHKHA